MNNQPKRKQIRIVDYDYSTPGAYFITVCTANREKRFWSECRGELSSPANIPLSNIGIIVNNEIQKLNSVYDAIRVDKYCIMPDHIHMILSINTDEDGRQIAAPTVSTVVGHMKRWVSMQLGQSIWQKSFIDRVIRNNKGYRAVWEYIENNPIKIDTSYDMPDFDNM